MKDNPLKNQRIHHVQRWLANIVAVFGIFLTIFLYYFWHNSINSYLGWLLLATGSAFSLIIGLLIRLRQVINSRNRALSNFQHELGERIKAEEGKQKLEIALLQGQKLQAIGTLAGGIAHDFNNLIYAIKGYAEMARDDISKDSVTHKNLGKVLDAANRGQELVARILAFGRGQQHYNFQPLDVKLILENVLSLLKPTIPSSVAINVYAKADNPIILGDQTQLHQVIVNLINNAVDAMDGEGEINIHISELAATDEYLSQFPNIKRSSYCKIDINDTGHGMDQTTMKRIFEPFFTTKEVGKGTGLGLSTVHTIMQEHHGEIAVKSKLGEGSTFTLIIPVYEPTNMEK